MKNKYTLFQKIKLCFWLIRTKIIWFSARLIRFPFDIRGKCHIDLGHGLTTGVGCRIEAFANVPTKTIVFGENVQINDYVHISGMKHVYIGNNVLIASHVYISDNSHGCYKGVDEDTSPEIVPIRRPYFIKEVSIEDNVWIGECVIIMPGVIIGKGCVIGAHSVVTKSIPAYSIAIGQPAVVVKQYNFKSKKWEKCNGNC